MPINREPGEPEDKFISRCISEEVSNGKEQDQAAAICYSYLTAEYITNSEVRKNYINSGKANR